MIYVPTEVMPASILAKLKEKRKCQSKTKTKMLLKTKKNTELSTCHKDVYDETCFVTCSVVPSPLDVFI